MTASKNYIDLNDCVDEIFADSDSEMSELNESDVEDIFSS